MHPVLLNIGRLTVYSYGFMLSLAFLAGLLIILHLSRREGIVAETVLDITVWVVVAAIAGARILYVVLFWGEFAHSPVQALMINRGGLVFYGGFIAGLLVIMWRAKKHGLSLWKVFDLAAPGTAVGYSIARIGCFLNGCCYGIETEFPAAVQFPHLTGLRHPTQLYASGTIFIVFLLLLYLWRRRKFEGQIFLLGVVFYSIYRFSIEFIRVGPRVLLGITPSQWISVLAFILAGGTLIWKLREK